MVWFVGGFGRQGFGAGLVMMLATAGWADAVTSVSYACERGTAIMASYLNVEGKSFAVVTAEGHQVAMELAKARAEMDAGSWLVSLEFAVPEVPPDATLKLAGDRAVWLYRIERREKRHAIPPDLATEQAASHRARGYFGH